MLKRLSVFVMVNLIFITFACCVAADAERSDPIAQTEGYLPTDVTRLHIVGADNSTEDQRLKLALRDRICELLSEWLPDCADKAEMDLFLVERLDDIQTAANDFLAAQGAEYGAVASFGQVWFPMRVYGDTVLPSGVYDALEIVLGEGTGNNWWCILFPRSCYKDSDGQVRYRSRIADLFCGKRKKKK